MFRQKEVVSERQSEMDKLDPTKRDAKWKEWETQDATKNGGKHCGHKLKAAGKIAAKSTMFGTPIAGLPTGTADDGSSIPAVLITLRKWVTKHGGQAIPDLFTKGSKGEGYATAKLSLNDPTGCKDCTDVYIAAALLLDFFSRATRRDARWDL